MTVVHPRDDPLEDSPGLWFRTLSSLHWRVWGGDTLHHHYIIHVHADLSTCHYNSLVPTALLPRPLTTVLIVVCAHMGRGHITSSLHHTCTCRPQYMPLQLISAHCPPAQASHNCSHSCVCVRIIFPTPTETFCMKPRPVFRFPD